MTAKTWLAGTASAAVLMQATLAFAQQTPAPGPLRSEDMAALQAAAEAEGMLTTIALPRDWCNYEGVFQTFQAKYPGITINELNPNASSAEELEAIRANRGNTGPQAPDVIDVGLAFGPQAQEEGLIQPYMVQTWDSIPESARDAEGYWYGDYYGVMSFAVNTDLVAEVPQSFADLLDPQYAGQVALAGDPRASNQAILAVMAAGLATGAEPGQAAGEAGLEFFRQLNEAGNFVPVIGGSGTLAQGTTPILIQWDYNALTTRDTLAGNPPVEVVIPEDVSLAGMYVQAISAYAPQPNAARLWMEHIYSDEGQLEWLKGYCRPIRFDDMVARGVVPQDLLDRLPPAREGATVVFPSLDAVNANRDAVVGGWDAVVGADVVE
mgnify:CR=1 FL=1